MRLFKLLPCVLSFVNVVVCSPAMAAETAPNALSICQSPDTPADAAIAACSDILKSDHLTAIGRSMAFARRARAFEVAGDRGWALADLDASLAIRSDNFIALMQRAELHLKSESFQHAIVDFDSAIRIRPQAFLFLDRGHAREKSGDLDGAIADYGEAARLEPDQPFGFHNRGRMHLARGHLDSAIADFDAAIKKNATIKEIFLDRGVAHQRNGEFEKSEVDLTQALALDPTWTLALTNRAVAHILMGKLDKTIDDYDAAIRLEPNSAMLFTARGTTWANKGDIPRAIADFDRALAINPHYDDALRQKSVAYAQQAKLRDPDRDLHQIETLLGFQPHNVELLSMRADMLIGKGQIDEALRDLAKVIDIDARNEKALVRRGAVQLDRNHPAEAIVDLDKAISLDPNDAKAFETRGCARVDLKQYDGAIADYDRALQLEPSSIWSLVGRGDAFAGLQQTERARADLTAALALPVTSDRNLEAREAARRILKVLDQGVPHAAAVQQFASTVAVVKTTLNACADIQIYSSFLDDFGLRLNLFGKDQAAVEGESQKVAEALARRLKDAPSKQAWCDATYRLYGPTGTKIPGLMRRR